MITSTLIAPCGMNCGVCIAHLREKNVCPGCSSKSGEPARACARCRIFNCNKLRESGSRFCYSCESYPCKRLKQLDKRYRTKYGMSMIENLESIRLNGIRKFVAAEKLRWKCSSCGSLLSVHRDLCPGCGVQKIKQVYSN